jgi:phage-related protein
MNKGCNVVYYSTLRGDRPVGDFLDSLSKLQQTKILRVINIIKTYGLEQARPYVKKLINTPFWEIRILGKDNIRAIYVVPYKDTVLILHGFVKKSQKTPEKELNLVYKRYKEWLVTAA